ncbi:MAG TPA: hypothetical protein PLJ47_12295 [Candidatus Hydrogenedentes bacterium]|nr:hypothetical protein [Candidatus Hydrogenedentota bacterium]
MKNTIAYIFGPELYWLAIYIAMRALALGNVPPTEAGSQALEKWWFLLPFVALPLTFAFLAVPSLNRWVTLLRINIAGFVGLCFAAYVITEKIDYQDTRNSGVPMGLFMSVIFGMFVQAVASVVSIPILLWLNRKRKQAHAIPPPLV